ncbi:hypothetical protein THRCLA_22949 [Thraustotheca clavata]|uniref:EF-hand domain-containing protein n=1 Tax=Thraustotheca clavata TaxID=74557 RepID=A0A1V9YMC7_9STRA|nr:hypothetical protein THRCLA_22949 [Thraustotheca clavata]
MLKKFVKRRNRDDSDNEKRVSVKHRDGKKSRAPLLDSSIVEALHAAILNKRKISTLELCQVFEKYDIEEVGSVDDTTFAKCIKKIGIQWKKEQLSTVEECFRLRKNAIDYYNFVDFAINPRDSEKLATIGADIRQSIEHYDKRSGEQPFNVFDELQRLDKNEKLWITCEAFQTFLEKKKPVDFELSAKQIRVLTDRFSFDYSDGKSGVDYSQFAQWLQPSFHFKLKDLQKRLSALLNESRRRNGLKVKDIFESIDEDESGFISRIEFKEALVDLGLPVTDAKIKCLVESLDKDGDGKINYKEFTAMFAEVSENEESEDDKKAKKTKKPQVKAYIDPAVLEAMQKAVHHKQRKNAFDVAAVFEKYDTEELGVLNEAKFIKGLSKLGVKLTKEQTSRLITGFRSSKNSSDSVDYYAFVDYLMYLPDTKKLEKILDNLQHKIRAYDKKSGEQPLNLFKSLEKLDTKERGWITQEAFESFFEKHSDIAFDLSSSEIKCLCKRFEYQYSSSYKGKTKMIQGIDYEQCAKWIQPSMHMDIKTLHHTVQTLIHQAQKAHKLNLNDVFHDIDDDDNGYITRLELKETLRAMGLPLTDTQIKLLMDEYDTNGDGKIEYKEFVQAMGSNEESDNEKKISKNKSTGNKDNKDTVLSPAIIKAISKAVRQDRKISSTELVSHFEKLDKEENGHLEYAEFQKVLSKCAIHLKKEQIKAIASCFRKGKKGIDYYDFVDFATNIADTDKLSTIGNRMRAAIAKYDKSSGEQPYNALESLRKGDKKKLLRLKPSTFESYLRSNGVVDYDLNDREISTILERFEFIYDDNSKGTDYEQFSRWLQPAMHYDLEELHLHVKRLFRKTKRSWKDLFNTMDEDGSGSVSCIEFKEALIDLGMPLTDGQIRCLIEEYDNDGDGKMQYKEFVKALADDGEESER